MAINSLDYISGPCSASSKDIPIEQAHEFFCQQFIISLYPVEYPFAIEAFRRVSEPSNLLNFNGYDRPDPAISGPSGLARTSNCHAARQGCAEARVTKTQTTRPAHRRPSSTPCTHFQFTELATRPWQPWRHSTPRPASTRRRIRPASSLCVAHRDGNERRTGPQKSHGCWRSV